MEGILILKKKANSTKVLHYSPLSVVLWSSDAFLLCLETKKRTKTGRKIPFLFVGNSSGDNNCFYFILEPFNWGNFLLPLLGKGWKSWKRESFLGHKRGSVWMTQCLCAFDLATCTLPLTISFSKVLVSCNWYLVSYNWCQVSGIWYLVSCIWYSSPLKT